MTAKDLKNALLQEAVQGKLVPQIASEGNARDLLEEIRKESGESLPLASARKRSSATPSAGSNAARNARFAPITEDEIPFEIPENWCWCRVGDITIVTNGFAFKPSDWSKDGIPIVRIQNLNNPNSTFNYYKGKLPADYCLFGNELLFGWSGTPGTSFGAHIWYGKAAFLNQHIFKLEFNESILLKKYYYYLLNQRVNSLINIAHGSAGLQHIKRGEFINLLIPIPPLEEQKRIVTAIEKMLPLCEKLGE